MSDCQFERQPHNPKPDIWHPLIIVFLLHSLSPPPPPPLHQCTSVEQSPLWPSFSWSLLSSISLYILEVSWAPCHKACWGFTYTNKQRNKPGAVKLVLWRSWMHEIQVHPVRSENQFHCTLQAARNRSSKRWRSLTCGNVTISKVKIQDKLRLVCTLHLPKKKIRSPWQGRV